MSRDFYQKQKWRDKRNHILRRDKYMDQLELRTGKQVPAEMVHHIFPLEKYPEYAYKDWNLISLSKDSHRELHTIYGDLSEAGKMLQRETANKQGIKLSTLNLIIGLPGTGKTTIAKQNRKEGLVYDLDYISAAFCLSEPGKDNKASRKMANSMAKAFAINARKYANRIYIIRTAPTIEELEAYEIDRLIICKTIYEERKDTENLEEKQERIEDAEAWAKANNIELLIL